MAANFLRQYDILLQKAKADLAIAFHAIDADDTDIDNDIIFFHYQQAVEKLLKALLSFNKVHFEKIHDIITLIDLCREKKIALPEYIDEFTIFNPYAVMGRYDAFEDNELDPRNYCKKLGEFKEFVQMTIKGNEKT